ncbi:SDR family oxidoreductase [Pontimonas sp.]|nr:SDR family oxidoreductase [Pontimonas sp.]MDB4607103.1 SDR family oxidoreductase [Pontimonas sp.]MDC0991615.1 SDR family oxidoreductase [Pontimonas sp.]
MKALVLGASGFLGSYAGFALEKAGWDVTGASRSSARGYSKSIDVGSVGDIRSVIRSQPWDVVINCVAIANHEQCGSDPSNALLVNQELPGMWADQAWQSGSRFVHFSTDAVFDGSSTDLYSEDDATGARSVYGQTKRAGEEAVLSANPEAFVFRTNFFGWSHDRARGILDFFANGLESGTSMTGFRDYVVSSLYMGHLFELMIEALSAEGSGIYHLVSSSPLSKYDFGMSLAHAMGENSDLIEPGLLADNPALSNRGHHLGLSVDKLEALVGHPIPSTTEGIEMALTERRAVMDYFGSEMASGE